MKDENLKVFIEGASHYFETVSNNPATIGAPFLTRDVNKYLCDYTGIIGISGNHKGSVFFSAPQNMLIHLLSSLGILSTSEDKLMDLVGEVSNTVAGNTRRVFGDQFMLSTPIVLKGTSADLKITSVEQIYVIPITWRKHQANLIINLD